MKLSEIETFLMLVKTKNITKTAENLFLSQPTVSHRLKLLEEELGIKLLERKKGYKQIVMTPEGEAFIPIAERWVYAWQEMLQLKNKQQKRNITIGCTDTLNSAIMYDFYKEIMDEDLMMNIHIKTHYSSEIYQYMENHEIDLGFAHHYLHFKNIVAEPIFSEKMYIIQSPNSQITKKLIHTDELDVEREIFLSWDTNYQIWHEQWIGKNERPRFQVDTFELLLHLLSSDNMWAIAPVSVVERIRKIREVSISEIANEQQPPERMTYMIRNKYQNEVTNKSIEFFINRLKMYLSSKEFSSLNKYKIEY